MLLVQYRVQGRTANAIAESIEAAIRRGDLDPGQPLPTVRVLAADLGVAAGTAAAAYQALRDRGLVQTRGRAGTFVRAGAPAARSAIVPPGPGVIDLASGQPSAQLLPVLDPELWSTLTGPAGAPAELVLPDLLEAARRRLDTDQVPTGSLTVAGGGLDAINQLLSAHLRAGDAVAVEDPGWPNLLDLIAALGLRTRPVTVDDHGPHPQSLRAALHAGARAVIITSRAQNPTGGYVTAARSDELWAVLVDYPQTLLIEDDHAAELAGVPLSTLAGATHAWAFVRSMSKPYGPDLRIAVIAGDDATIARAESRLRTGSGWVSTLLQRVALHLWTSADAAACVAQAARAYDTRRTQLINELAAHRITAAGATGLNVWVPVTDENSTIAALHQQGWAVAPGSRFRQSSAPGIRITVSALDQDTIPQLSADLTKTLTGTTATSYST